jgi:branched-chain amino acid transport system substrate-binding protein
MTNNNPIMSRTVALTAAVFALSIVAASAHAEGTLRLGLLADLSGSFGPSGAGERNGLQIYLAHHNNMLGGLKVEVFTEDTAGDPATAISKAHKLVESDKIDVMLGPTSSSAGMAIKTYVVEQKIPTFIESTVDEVLDGKYIFRTTFNGNADAYAAGFLMGTAGFKKAVFLAPNYIAGQTAIENAVKGFAATGGTAVQSLLPRIGVPDYGSFIAQFSGEAEVAFVFLPGTDGVRFIKQYADFGKTLPLYGPSVTVDEQQLSVEGKAAEGFVAISSYFSNIDVPENKVLLKAWGAGYQGQERPTWQTVGGYIAAQMLDRAIGKLKGRIDNKDALIKEVEQMKLDTPLGSFHFDADHNPISPRYIAQIREVAGKTQPVVIGVVPEYLPKLQPPTLPPGLVLPR